MRTELALALVLLMARLVLGAYFFIAGYNKVAGPGVGNFVASQLDNARQFMPDTLARVYLGSLPWVEMITGAFLALGLFVRGSALLITLMLISFTIAVGGLELNLARISGGNGPPFNKNIVFLSLSLLLMVVGGGHWVVERWLFAQRRSK